SFDPLHIVIVIFFFSMLRRPLRPTLFPYTTLFRSQTGYLDPKKLVIVGGSYGGYMSMMAVTKAPDVWAAAVPIVPFVNYFTEIRSEEHTSELQSPCNLVCRLLLEKKNNTKKSY